mgnify:CR=1 FL=1
MGVGAQQTLKTKGRHREASAVRTQSRMQAGLVLRTQLRALRTKRRRQASLKLHKKSLIRNLHRAGLEQHQESPFLDLHKVGLELIAHTRGAKGWPRATGTHFGPRGRIQALPSTNTTDTKDIGSEKMYIEHEDTSYHAVLVNKCFLPSRNCHVDVFPTANSYLVVGVEPSGRA